MAWLIPYTFIRNSRQATHWHRSIESGKKGQRVENEITEEELKYLSKKSEILANIGLCGLMSMGYLGLSLLVIPALAFSASKNDPLVAIFLGFIVISLLVFSMVSYLKSRHKLIQHRATNWKNTFKVPHDD